MPKRGPYEKPHALESKRRKLERDRERGKRRVFIGEEFERWNQLKDESGVKNHEEWAKTLLDSYQDHLTSESQTSLMMDTSEMTPPLIISDISSAEDIQPIPGHIFVNTGCLFSLQRLPEYKVSRAQSIPIKEGAEIQPLISASEISSAEDVPAPSSSSLTPRPELVHSETDVKTSKRRRKTKDLSSICEELGSKT